MAFQPAGNSNVPGARSAKEQAPVWAGIALRMIERAHGGSAIRDPRRRSAGRPPVAGFEESSASFGISTGLKLTVPQHIGIYMEPAQGNDIEKLF
jgi:hypothetical protein